MKDWNDAHRAGVNIVALAAATPRYRPNGSVTESGLITRCAADIRPEPIEWIWDGRLARGKLTVIGGDPEEGKSQIGVYLAR